MTAGATILVGDCRESLRALPDKSVQCVVTSPPFVGLRRYLPEGHRNSDREIGTHGIERYVADLLEVFSAVSRVLRDDGVVFLELGDAYTKTVDPSDHARAKDLVGAPWRVAFALQEQGWHLRQEIILHRKNPMPSSVNDRCVSAHTTMFLLTKSTGYYFDHLAIREPATEMRSNNKVRRVADGTRGRPADHLGSSIPWTNTGQGRNRRDVWSYPSARAPRGALHFAVMNPDIAEVCIRAGSREGDVVLDPFAGSLTTPMVALKLGRHAVACELNEDFAAEFRWRVSGAV